MKKTITHLFVDIGGVLLTDGWDRNSRKLACEKFGLDENDIENRHHLNFDTYEVGKLSINEYLDRVIFYTKRPFSKTRFLRFMFDQSQPYPKMLHLISQLKKKYALHVFAVSNEARELNSYRIETFKLNSFIDAFISSCYVHLRKPDVDIFRLALDISQANIKQIVYIENTRMFVEIAKKIGIQSILHTDYEKTKKELESFGLKL